MFGELTVDPEYIAMCKGAEAFRTRFRRYIEKGKYLRWWDERFHEVRQMVLKEDDELATFGEFGPEFVFLPTIDQLLKFTANSIEALATIDHAVRLEKKSKQKYYTWLSSVEKRLLALIMWQDARLTWDGHTNSWGTSERGACSD